MSLRSRFLLLTVLRWLPTGFLIPTTAVFMQTRGLSLAQLGLVSATQGVVVVLLELPSGGFADVLGHRRALVVAGLVDLGSIALLLAAHDLWLFLVVWALQGLFRALDSGPLEAWYVDAALAADPDADIEHGLAGASVAVGIGIVVGSLGTAVAVALFRGDDADVLMVPLVAALVLRAVDLVLVRALMTDRPGDPVRALDAVRVTPQVVRRGVAALLASRALTALVLVEVLWGAGMLPVELFAGPRLFELEGDPLDAVVTFGLVLAAAWAIQAAGSTRTGWIVRVTGSPANAGAVLRIVQGGFVVLGALLVGVPGLIVAYFGFYLVHGAANAVHYGLVHRATGPGERATMISLNSLAGRVGGIVSGLALGAVASGHGTAAAFVLAGLLMASAAPLYLRCRPVG